jgi:hypothetical protein
MDANSNVLGVQNPWWAGADAAALDPQLAAIQGHSYYYHRPITDDLAFSPGVFHIVRGARQVGKTTLVKLWIRRVLQEELAAPSDVLYLSCEALEGYKELHELLVQWLHGRKSFACVFLDEISFVDDWQRAILSIINAGLLRNASLVVTGSNARDLKRSAERFPGRRAGGLDVDVHPLSPVELGQTAAFKAKPAAELAAIYLRCGGFPHAVRDYVTSGRVTDETYRTYMNWVIGDAAKFSIQVEALQHIMHRIATTLPSRVTWSSLIEHTPVKSHETAITYVEHLEDAFLCKVHLCWDEAARGPAIHKARKLFFVDPLLVHLARGWKAGLTNIWALAERNVADPEILGGILEGAYVSCLTRLQAPIYFWYSTKVKKEVDIVVPRGDKVELYDSKVSGGTPYKALGTSVAILDQDGLVPFLRSRGACGE